MTSLTSSLQLGKSLTLRNRYVMASMTRDRAPRSVPDQFTVEYYAQRAGAGLVLSEGVLVEAHGTEWPSAPGIFNAEQVQAWRKVTDAVHAKGSLIYAQLWHVGRVAHPLHQANQPVVGPSAIAAKGGKFRYLVGEPGYTTPKAIDDPKVYVEMYRRAAINAKAAGFDGVELHNANGYLPHQFLESHSNKRTDAYGGSIENRARFTLETLHALIAVYGGDSKRVGIKLSPCGGYNDMGEASVDEARKLYGYLLTEIDKLALGYVQMARYLADFDAGKRGLGAWDVVKEFRGMVKNSAYIANGGYTKDEGNALLASNGADAIAFGRPFIANPDLPTKQGDLAWPDWGKLYGVYAKDGSGLLVNPAEGYTTY